MTNQGSAVDKNVKVTATLDKGQSFVSSTGATKASAEGNKITFDVLPTLAPKARATWRVIVKADAAGDKRFAVTMKSDTIGRSVDETEATNFYE